MLTKKKNLTKHSELSKPNVNLFLRCTKPSKFKSRGCFLTDSIQKKLVSPGMEDDLRIQTVVGTSAAALKKFPNASV